MSAVAELPLVLLRPYQVDSVDGVHSLMHAGKKRVILVVPTGGGKRYLALWWALKAMERERDVLFATDRRLLIDQPSKDLHGMKVPHGLLMGGYEPQLSHRIQLGTIQTIQGYMERGELPNANLLLIDEVHKSMDAYTALMECFPDTFSILLTATPVGADGKSLVRKGYADAMYEGVKNSDLIRMSFLLPTRIIAPSEPNLEGIHSRDGEFIAAKLGARMGEVTCFGNVWDEWACWADRQTIVFAPSIAYANGLARSPDGSDSFYARGISCDVLTSKTKNREDVLERFRKGETRVLISVDMLREGFDVPSVSCSIDLQPNKQFRTVWQKWGRTKRGFEGQNEAVVIDMAGNALRHKFHPDDDPPWPTGDETMDEVLSKHFKRSAAMIRCPKCAEMHKPQPKCPKCGYERQPRDVVKVMRMGNGKMREVKAEELREERKTEKEKRLGWWSNALFGSLQCGHTLQQAAHKYKSKAGRFPDQTLPLVRPFGSGDWKKKVAQLHSKEDLWKAFNPDKVPR